ncbi:MAG: Dabb family protein [Thermomicrobiales bacterium]
MNPKPQTRIRHLALFRFKSECGPEDIHVVWQMIEVLQRQIPGILELTYGPNVSTEGLDDGFTHSLAITFENVAARDAYLPHPAHQKVVDFVLPKLEKVIVLDHDTAPPPTTVDSIS